MVTTPKRILVVEDSELLHRYLREALVLAGFDCIFATSAGEALSMLDDDGGCIDAMIVDVGLPGMNGVELGKRIATDYQDIPVVLMTGNLGHPSLQNEGQDADLILQKPFNVSDLEAAIARATRS